eukprot:8937805-Alexandrium_andersonii.AAC.1
MHVCVHACVRAYARACGQAGGQAGACACARACGYLSSDPSRSHAWPKTRQEIGRGRRLRCNSTLMFCPNLLVQAV